MKPKVLVGVSGGVAAYKAADVVSQLVKAGCDVRVVMTESATKFVGPATFAALTQEKVLTSMFPESNSGGMDIIYPHLYPATEADAFLVIPATANTISKIAHGLGDDLVSCSALSLKSDCKRIFCPAMNFQMWGNPVVQDNVKKLLHYGWHQVGPEKGRMACGTSGYGRLSAQTVITQIVLNSVF
ncbi:flavoprotein [Pontiella agarivorans]|uniref:Flavoprotein n=1 Tax=Pontiella agarivorans TaxID=3038953 RepID=A0ABU5N1R5_9BACT|nr:flavoprotein [Pontiella agarivorans]MDZ8120380.1 flavoprotein [Pontiella agarivorans]